MIGLPSSKRTAAFLLAFTLFTISAAFAQTKLPPKQRALELLAQNITATGLSQTQLENFIVSDAYEDKRSGIFLVYLQQTRLNIPVYNKISIYSFRYDSLIEKKQDFIRRFPASSAKSTGYFVDAEQAVRLASNHFSIPLFKNPEILARDESRKRFIYRVAGQGIDSTTSELVWLPVGDGNVVRLAWNVRIVSPDKQGDWFVRIDAHTGEYLNDNSLTVSERMTEDCALIPATKTSVHSVTDHSPTTVSNFDSDPNFVIQSSAAFAPPPPSVTSASYRVYPVYLESQNFGSRVLETNPWERAGVGNNATTLGWHFDNTTNYDLTRGNNVWAQEDLAGADATTGLTDNSTTAIPALTFDKPVDFSQNPSNNSNMRAAIDNLFYWNNIMHDVSYQYGFDEAAGNFQTSNLGRGGIGNDYVHAFAESGGGMNNANFNTPPDGQNPTMRMYQWNTAVIPSLQVSSPSPIPTSYNIVEGAINLNSQLGYTGSKTANIVRVLDAGGTSQGCGFISNAAALAGNIALVDRGGGCSFAIKIKNIQNAGAIAVIVVNNVAGAPLVMGGTDLTITIPAVMISMDDGTILKNNLTGLAGTLSTTGLFRDGSLDNGIIAHEYTHGISNRLTGGPASAGCLVNAEQMGEGWSDYVSLMLTTNWAAAGTGDGANARTVGSYALSQTSTGGGIRIYPYSTNMTVDPWTYGMMAGSTGGEVHTIGEIWCSALWDMTWNIIQQEGINADIYRGSGGNNIALQLVVAGMKYQPCSPGFLDARDAILKADSILYGYRHKCAIWNAFARRGMGRSASQGSSNSYTDQVQAMDLPVGLGISKTADKNSFHNGENITYTINAYCDCGSLSNISIVDTLADGLTYVSSSGGTYISPSVRFTGINFMPGETKTFTIQAKVSGNPGSDILINDTRDPANYSWTSSIIVGGTQWSSVTTRAHSGSGSWFAPDQPTRTDFVLTSGNLLLDTLSVLSFWHYFETDPGYDGGLVEISTDGGSVWQDLGAYMTMNRYNSSLDPSVTGLGNRAAFTGSSGGVFIQTVITLTGFAGTTARIRFRFASDVIDGGAGWWVDDIVLTNEKGIVNNAFAYTGTTLLSKNNTYGFLTAGIVLPVHFINFEANKQGSSAALHWRVADEVNVSKYVVERSRDGVDFQAIDEVAYNATGGGDKDYYYTDRNPLAGNNYYRIAEQDIDGRSTISNVRLVRFTGGRGSIILSPVPTYNHKAQLIIGYESTGTFNAYLVNNAGQVLKVFKVQKGTNDLNLENFVPGVYYLKVQLSDGRTEVKKLIIQ